MKLSSKGGATAKTAQDHRTKTRLQRLGYPQASVVQIKPLLSSGI
jgi:hypothetical protein